MALIYWENIIPGEVSEFGSKTVDRKEMLAFAGEYDPHPLHLDEQAARAAGHQDLVASGWQVSCFCMRMMVDERLRDSTSQGSPGIDSLRWLKPVYPGDKLHVRQEVISSKLHPRRLDVGFVNSVFELINQRAEIVMRMHSGAMFLRRQSGAEEQ